MRIAILFDPDVSYLEKKIFSLFLEIYIKNLLENKHQVELYTSFKDLKNKLSNTFSFKINDYTQNIKEILNKNYDVIHNFANKNIALISSFTNKNFTKIINTLFESPFDNNINNLFPKSFNISSNIYSQNKDYFLDYIPITFQECENREIENFSIINIGNTLKISNLANFEKLLQVDNKKYIFYSENSETLKPYIDKYNNENNIFISKDNESSFFLIDKCESFTDFSENELFEKYCLSKKIPFYKDGISSNSLPKISDITKQYENLYLSLLDKESKLPDNKLKIVFCVNAPPFDGSTPFEKGLGGTESAIVYISKQLAKLGHEVTVFCNCPRPNYYDNVLYQSRNDFLNYVENNITDILIVVREHFIWSELKAKVIIFWTEDDANQNHPLEFAEKSFRGKLIDKVFVVSNYQKSTFMSYLNIPEDKFYVTRNGINPEFFEGEEEERKLKLIYTSVPHKGLEILIKVFPKIKEQIPELELDVYGSDTIYSRTEDENLKDNGHIYELAKEVKGINILAPISQPELAKILKTVSLFAYPNKFAETSCITALESQTAGTPIITSHLGALPETVSPNITGICIKGNPYTEEYQKEFIDTVLRLLKDKDEWSKFSNNGKKRMLKYFKWEIISKEWNEEFNSLLIEHDTLKNIFRVLNKINKLAKSNNLQKHQAKELFKLYELAKLNFFSVKTIFLEKDILSDLLKNYIFTEEIKFKIEFNLANILYLTKEENEADLYFISCIERFENLENKDYTIKDLDFAYYKSITYFRDKDYKKALSLCLNAIDIFPNSDFINIRFIEFLIDQKQYNEVTQKFNNLIKIYSDFPNKERIYIIYLIAYSYSKLFKEKEASILFSLISQILLNNIVYLDLITNGEYFYFEPQILAKNTDGNIHLS